MISLPQLFFFFFLFLIFPVLFLRSVYPSVRDARGCQARDDDWRQALEGRVFRRVHEQDSEAADQEEAARGLRTLVCVSGRQLQGLQLLSRRRASQVPHLPRPGPPQRALPAGNLPVPQVLQLPRARRMGSGRKGKERKSQTDNHGLVCVRFFFLTHFFVFQGS